MERRRVAVLGGGTVGAELVRLLQRHPAAAAVELLGVLVRDAERERPFAGWRELVTTDPGFVQRADVVVEVLGGTGLAADLSLEALARGATVVTANKAALTERFDEYLPYLRAGRVHCEAAVMAGTPVVGPLTGALAGSRPLALHGVLNGTCNVVLARMDAGASYADALAEAQRLGYAEADPTLDVEGVDAAHKLTLLGRLAFDPALAWEGVRRATRGIARLAPAALAAERERGRRVRLVASLVPGAAGWEGRVRPVALPEGHPLLTDGATNALLFRGDPLGEVLLRGPGAGGGATASGVLGDLLACLRGEPGPRPPAAAAPLPDAPGADEPLDEVADGAAA